MTIEQLTHIIPVIEQVQLYTTTHSYMPASEVHAILIVRKGHVTITSDHEPANVCTLGYALHPSQESVTIEVPRTKLAEYALITYHNLPANMPWSLHGPLHTFSEEKIHYMLDELLRNREHPHSEIPDYEEAAERFRERFMLERILFIYLYETHMKREDKSSSHAIEDSLSYIHEHYMLPLTLPMLAERARMSEGHYTVLFKKLTGTTMTNYLRTIRMNKAKQLLEHSDLPAKEIAQRVGYTNYFHFSKVFKKEVGYPPIEFQRQSQT